MSPVTGILDSIDGALRDHETSADAMRWVPEEERKPAEAGPAFPWRGVVDGEWIEPVRPLAARPGA
jgi:hypothetical protein